jgi:hypothetical protein
MPYVDDRREREAGAHDRPVPRPPGAVPPVRSAAGSDSTGALAPPNAIAALVRLVEELLEWEGTRPCPEMPWALRSQLEAAVLEIRSASAAVPDGGATAPSRTAAG